MRTLDASRRLGFQDWIPNLRPMCNRIALKAAIRRNLDFAKDLKKAARTL
jgi:hypothetical protein